ncbi:MAG: crotonase/enoyl-CoA hydratase family protein [Planctomycetota bacterium]|nr:crotonase/enoyl-CoA hydratase family protein [Planctomycetota bacterium]
MSVRIETSAFVTTVILSRPEKRNAVDGPTAAKLAKAFNNFENDENARVAVLYGDGGNFCAGADLKALSTPDRNRLDKEGDGPMGPTRMYLSKPVIAAISGYAVAGGLELALWCDLRVMEKSACMGVFCRRFGVPLIDGGTVRLPRLIGQSRALDLILTGRAVHSEEALAMGLANRIVEDGSAREQAEKLAAKIAAFPQLCMKNDRRSCYEQSAMSMNDAMANEFRLGMKTVASGETLNGSQSFIDGVGRHGQFPS